MNSLQVIATKRTRNHNGTFADGKILTTEETREKNRIRQAEWNKNNHARRLAIAARDREKHPERVMFHNSKDPMRSRRSRRQMGEKALGRACPEVCETPGCGRTGKIHFDHCHKTNRARGWLCFNCNAALGHVADKPEVLRALAAYLEGFNIGN